MTPDLKQFLRAQRLANLTENQSVLAAFSFRALDYLSCVEIRKTAREVFAEPQPSTLNPSHHPALI